MDKEKQNLFEEINEIYNSRFQCETIGSLLFHMPTFKVVTLKYNKYTFSDFVFIWRLECLLDKGIITEDRKKDLLELFNLYYQLMNEIGTHDNNDNEDNIIYKKLDDIELVFNNYHLLDEINLMELISNSVKVDTTNIDMTEVSKLLKR